MPDPNMLTTVSMVSCTTVIFLPCVILHLADFCGKALQPSGGPLGVSDQGKRLAMGTVRESESAMY